MVELLVALAIASAFLSGVYMTFIQIIRAHDTAEARREAIRNARVALDQVADDFKQLDAVISQLVGVDIVLPFGDGLDNDGDGMIDEEVVDGLNNDFTPDSAAPLISDRHAQIDDDLFERPLFVNRFDLGDADVDEDVLFGRDIVTLRILPSVPTPEVIIKRVDYFIGEFDNQNNVLLRQTEIFRENQEPLFGVSPLAFGVLSFDLLYWDPNAAPEDQGWVTSWDSTDAPIFNPPQLSLPASVYIRLAMTADRRPEELTSNGQPVDTIVAWTMVNIEQTINDGNFPRPTP